MASLPVAVRTDVKSFAYKRDADRWRKAWRAATGYGGSTIRAGGRGRNRSWLVYYDVPPGALNAAARKLVAGGSFYRGNPVQYEGDDKPTPRAARPRRARSPLGAFERKHLAAWLKSERPRGQRAARAAIMRALTADPDLLKQGRGWSEIERLGQLDNPRARRRRVTRKNPGAWSGHASVRGGELFSRRVLEVKYEHVDDPAHVARRHPFGPGVFMYALKDGSVLIRHREHPRTRVWADLPDKGRR